MQTAAFQAFQHAMANYLRQPQPRGAPTGVSPPRAAIYHELVMSNIGGFLDSCFPVCQQVLGPTRWQRLQRSFVRDWPQHSPWFRDIPKAFAHYLREARIATPRPQWLADLAHYEWLELDVDLMPAEPAAFDTHGDLIERPVVVNPTIRHCHSDWPVHRISGAWRPHRRSPTDLMVYRDADDEVRFAQVNPVTAALLGLLQQRVQTGHEALMQIGRDIHYPDPQQLLSYGASLLNQLREQGMILGAYDAHHA